jgi:hypothetical protein
VADEREHRRAVNETVKIESLVPTRGDDMSGGGGRSRLRARAQLLITLAAAAKANMAAAYGTDITVMSSSDYKSRVRRLMMRG